MNCTSLASEPLSLSVFCLQHCKRAHFIVKKSLQELRRGGKKKVGAGVPGTKLRVKVCVCNVSVMCWIIHAPAPQLVIEGGENKMFKTYLDDFSGGAV